MAEGQTAGSEKYGEEVGLWPSEVAAAGGSPALQKHLSW